MRAVVAAFEAADDDGPLGQIDVIPTKVASLAHAQAVAVDEEADQPIAMAVPIALERRQQPVHFRLGQVFTDPIGCVWLARRGHWSQNSAFDQLEVCRFHWRSPRSLMLTGRNMIYFVNSVNPDWPCRQGRMDFRGQFRFFLG